MHHDRTVPEELTAGYRHKYKSSNQFKGKEITSVYTHFSENINVISKLVTFKHRLQGTKTSRRLCKFTIHTQNKVTNFW